MMDAQTFNYDKMQRLNGVSQDGSISSTAFRIVYRISDYLNKVSGTAWPSYGTLAKQVSLSTKSVQRAVDALKKADWLKVDRTYKKSNGYRPTWPPGFQRKTEEAKRRTGQNWATQWTKTSRRGGHRCLPILPSNLPRTNLRRPGETSTTRRSFPDRGRFEQDIFEQFGQEAEELSEDLQQLNPGALDELCRKQRDPRLTQVQFDWARLGVAELQQRLSR